MIRGDFYTKIVLSNQNLIALINGQILLFTLPFLQIRGTLKKYRPKSNDFFNFTLQKFKFLLHLRKYLNYSILTKELILNYLTINILQNEDKEIFRYSRIHVFAV